ncbi:hypothetical protein XELAEV_18000308mg [Xenopus laevis]|uniref:Uncharacterized protein n=1 Tax=Xenopus laevis TaxID=8355 RepID=A0A974BPF4_XENLA|nr:hypothetical protein XELAEV_18000308mg [Xenopus laevis]
MDKTMPLAERTCLSLTPGSYLLSRRLPPVSGFSRFPVRLELPLPPATPSITPTYHDCCNLIGRLWTLPGDGRSLHTKPRFHLLYCESR